MSAAPETWPLALRVLCGCLGAETTEDTRALAGQMSRADWNSFVYLACGRHRVAPVVATQLGALSPPPGVADELRREVRQCTIETLRQGAALNEILAEFAQAGIDPVILKGIPLAERLYGAAGNRHARDIDILVRPTNIACAAGILDRLGYVPAPVYRLRGLLVGTRALAQECYDLEYVGGRGHMPVELHWRTSHYAGWPDFTETPELTEMQNTAHGPVRVPTDPANLIYLAGHASMHAWARLKWLADIGRLAAIRGEAGLTTDLELADRLGGKLPASLGLRLAHRLMGTPLPPALLHPGAQVIRLEDQMMAVIAAPEADPGGWRYKLSANLLSLRLAEGPAQVMGVVRYAIWRRLRLGSAGLMHRLGLRPSLQ